MIPSPQKTDPFSPPKSSQLLFSVTAPNPQPLPRQFFRRGSIGSKSWKLGDVNQIQSQIQSGIKSNNHCDIRTIQRCESADQNFVHAPRTLNRSPHQSGLCSAFDPPKRLSEESDPAAFSHLFSFKPPRSLHRFASFGSNATGLYSRRTSPTLQSENVATSSTAPSLSLPKFASSRFLIKSQASRTSLTPPPSERVSSKMTLPSQLTGTSQADPLMPTLHSVSQDKDSIELTQASQPADPSGENRSAEVRSAGDIPIDSTITGDNMQEITVEIVAEPLIQPQVKSIQRRPVDIKPDNVVAAGGHKDSTFPNSVNGFNIDRRPSTSGGERREDTVNSLNTPIEERNRESLKLLKAVDDRINELNMSTQGMQKLNSTTASALESLKMKVEDFGTCLNTKDELRHVEVIKAVEASSMQLDVLRACFRTEMKDECRSRTVEMVDATRKLLDNINESLQSLQQAQNQETRTALEAMEARLHGFQNDAQTAQFTQRQEITKALEETQVRMDKINASVLNLQNEKCLEADRMIEAVGSRMDVLQGDIQAMQGDQRTGAERVIEAIDSRLTEFRGDISVLQESVQRLKEERDCLIKERADNEDRTQAVESLIAKLDSALNENAYMSKDLERRVENELAAKSRCDDQWVQISKLQIQTQELDRQVASLKTERQRLQDKIDATHGQAATIEAENQQLRSSLAQTALDHDARLKSTISDFEKECTREAAEVEILNQLHLSSITLLETDLKVKTELLQEQEERREILSREHEEHVGNVLKERDKQQQEIQRLNDRIYELEQDLEQQRHEKEQTATTIEQGKQTALSQPMLLTNIERAHIQEHSKNSLNELSHWMIDLTSSPDKPTYQDDSRVDFVKSEPASQDHVTTRSSSKRKAQQIDLECEADSAAKSGKRDDQTYVTDDAEDFEPSQLPARQFRSRAASGSTGSRSGISSSRSTPRGKGKSSNSASRGGAKAR